MSNNKRMNDKERSRINNFSIIQEFPTMETKETYKATESDAQHALEKLQGHSKEYNNVWVDSKPLVPTC